MNRERVRSIEWARWSSLLLGAILFVVFLANPFALPPAAAKVAAVTALVVVYWVTVCLPLPVASLLPIVLFPLLGVMSSRDVIGFYAEDSIYLFLGGFIYALAMEKWGVQKRIALLIAQLVGTSPRRLVLGFFFGSGIVSMIISNTATAMMMFPVALAVVTETARLSGDRDDNFSVALLLAVAYGASIGGVGTPIGSPPNIVFLGLFGDAFPAGPKITFFTWAKVFVPFVLLFIPVAWVVLTSVLPPKRNVRTAGRDVIESELSKLGALKGSELRVLFLFAVTVLLWVFRQPIDLEFLAIPGWNSLFPEPGFLSDATVAIAMASLLFFIPAGVAGAAERDNPVSDDEESSVRAGATGFLMDWQTALRLPWGILLLFGGGFAIAGGFKQSGLDVLTGQAIRPFLDFHPLLVVAVVALMLVLMTEVASNTATAAAILPIMIGAAQATGLNPLLLMAPAAIAASLGFMLPVGTPPNAIVFSSGLIPMRKMLKAGLVLDLLAVFAVTLWVYFVVLPAWGQGIALPDWAMPR